VGFRQVRSFRYCRRLRALGTGHLWATRVIENRPQIGSNDSHCAPDELLGLGCPVVTVF